MKVWTALDLLGGQVVRLSQGRRRSAVSYGEPLEVLSRWVAAGLARFHFVDLGAAFGETPTISGVVKAASAQWPNVVVQAGGGIRSLDDALLLTECGASRVVIGSLLFHDPPQARRIASQLGPDRCVAALDVSNGAVRTHGWLDSSGLDLESALETARRCGFGEALVTDISRDGVLTGPNLALYRSLASSPLPILASGGLSSAADLEALGAIPSLAGVVVGRALYEGRVDPETLRRCEA